MTTTEALVLHALQTESFGRTEQLALRAAFRADGVTNLTVRDLTAEAARSGAIRLDAGARVRAIWSCV